MDVGYEKSGGSPPSYNEVKFSRRKKFFKKVVTNRYARVSNIIEVEIITKGVYNRYSRVCLFDGKGIICKKRRPPMSKLFKTIMAFTLITVLSVCIVFESNATPVVTKAIDQHTVDEGDTDTEQLSSTSEVDSWTMKPAQGFINFFMNDIPIASVYQMTLLKGNVIIATATNAGKTNALIKCRVNGTST